jgi:alpha-D-ribose 1-methylphosphonate 5-phosphate C-P lyase
MHALEDYSAMYVKLYEDITQFGYIATSYNYPVRVNHRYLMSPSPIPRFDNPKMNQSPALQLFGAGREKRIYAIPPYTTVKSLDFEDHPFTVETWNQACEFCGSTESYLDEVVINNEGKRMWICSDTDYCQQQQKLKSKKTDSGRKLC